MVCANDKKAELSAAAIVETEMKRMAIGIWKVGTSKSPFYIVFSYRRWVLVNLPFISCSRIGSTIHTQGDAI